MEVIIMTKRKLRGTSFLMAAAILISAFTLGTGNTFAASGDLAEVSNAAEGDIFYGDLTGDGELSLEDALLMRKNIAKLVNLTQEQQLAADVYQYSSTDIGTIDITDALVLQKTIAQLLQQKDLPIKDKVEQPTAPVKKKAEDYIKSAYSKTFYDGYSNVSYDIPNIVNIDSSYAKTINNELNALIKEIKGSIASNSLFMYQGETLLSLNGSVLSLVIPFKYNGGFRRYDVYNINVNTGNEVTNTEILKNKNISSDAFVTALKKKAKENFLEIYPYGNVESYVTKDRYDKYLTSAVSSTFCNVDTPMFLNNKGSLCVVLGHPSLAGPDGNNTIVDMGI